MPLVRVKEKHQVTIPAEVRKKLNLKVGDYLEVETRGDVILLRPKAVVVVDRAKEKAWKRLHALLDQVHHKIGQVPEEEVEQAVREAIQALREGEAK